MHIGFPLPLYFFHVVCDFTLEFITSIDENHKCPYSSHWLHGLIHLHHFHSKSSFVFYDYILTCYWLNERPLFFIITNVFFFCKFLQLGNPKKRMENPTKEFLKLNFFLPYLDAKNLEVAKFF